MQDEYNLDLASIDWVIQDTDTGGMENLPSHVRTCSVGEIDALIYPEIPDVLGALRGLRRLLSDSRSEEVEYFRRSGVFPIMHTLVLRRELVDDNPWLPFEVLRAFRRAKDDALEDLGDPRKTALAWVRDSYEQQLQLMGRDPWGYDIKSSRAVIETLVRYAAEQGIIPATVRVEELFCPTTTNEPPGYIRR